MVHDDFGIELLEVQNAVNGRIIKGQLVLCRWTLLNHRQRSLLFVEEYESAYQALQTAVASDVS